MEDVGMKSGSFVTEVGQERTQPDGENRQSSPSCEWMCLCDK